MKAKKVRPTADDKPVAAPQSRREEKPSLEVAASATGGDWRVEAVSDCVRIVVGTGRAKIILARLNPKQLPEAETEANAKLMALSPRLRDALSALVDSGLIGGEYHPVELCGCWGCRLRRLVSLAKGMKAI